MNMHKKLLKQHACQPHGHANYNKMLKQNALKQKQDALQWNIHKCHRLSYIAIVNLSSTTESTCIHTSIHLTCSPFTLTENMVAEVKMDKSTYLMMKSIRNQLCCCNVPPNHRPACSLISQQHCHPRAGHDSPRNKGTSSLTHSQGYTNT